MEERKPGIPGSNHDRRAKFIVSRKGREGDLFRAEPEAGAAGSNRAGHQRVTCRGHLRLAGTDYRTLRILVADSQPMARLGLRSLLNAGGSMKVVGETGDGVGALRLTRNLRPDVVILGLELGASDGSISVCREMKALPTPPRLLVHTTRATSEELAEAVIEGADGYAHKGLNGEQLTEVVRRIGVGECVWMLGSHDSKANETLPEDPAKGCLTRREREVFGLVVKRYSNGEIASRLGTSLYTVKNQVSSVLRKLGASSRKQLLGSP